MVSYGLVESLTPYDEGQFIRHPWPERRDEVGKQRDVEPPSLLKMVNVRRKVSNRTSTIGYLRGMLSSTQSANNNTYQQCFATAS